MRTYCDGPVSRVPTVRNRLSTTMTDELLRFENVHFAYDLHRPVLDDCSCVLLRGSRIALCGDNGSGKSTLLKLAVGLLRPASGTVWAFGRPRTREADFYEVRCRAGLLFQNADDQLFCPTVAEDVAFGPFNLGKSRDEVERIVAETLGNLGLSGYEERVTHKLSGGEKRLVALAGVLAMQPEVLLLDEPAAGLDEAAVARLAELLVRLPQTLLVAAHDRAFLTAVTNHRWQLQRGRIADLGSW